MRGTTASRAIVDTDRRLARAAVERHRSAVARGVCGGAALCAPIGALPPSPMAPIKRVLVVIGERLVGGRD